MHVESDTRAACSPCGLGFDVRSALSVRPSITGPNVARLGTAQFGVGVEDCQMGLSNSRDDYDLISRVSPSW
jgi:hypothetical protein